jgi:membrane protein implicated in regulation of membrane protease activity
MDPTLIGSVLLVAGLVCLLLEAKLPGFFIAIPGTVMVLLGAMGLLVPGLLLSAVAPLIALLGAAGAGAVTIRFYKALGPSSAPPITSHPEGLVGEWGVVVKAIDQDGRGRVRVHGQLWSSTAYEALPIGTQVMVLGTEQGLLVVGEAPEDLRHGHLPAAGGQSEADPARRELPRPKGP